MTAPLLAVEGLEIRYGPAIALRDVGFTLAAGEGLAVLGANGAGKSTLMRALIGLRRPSAGRIHLDGRPITSWPPDRRARQGIGYCPEGRRAFPGLTVRENLEVACRAGRAERDRRIAEAFALFPALAEFPVRPAWQLSGGQQQMLAIGRSLMGAPRLLLLDEPSLGLSPRLTELVLGQIPHIRARGVAVLLAEQNAARALQMCGSALLLQGGAVVERGSSAELAGSDAVRRAFLGG